MNLKGSGPTYERMSYLWRYSPPAVGFLIQKIVKKNQGGFARKGNLLIGMPFREET